MGAIDSIGGTPVVRLERLAGEDGAEVWVKLEGANPTGANLVAALELARRLGPGHRVVTVQVDSGLKYLAGKLYG